MIRNGIDRVTDAPYRSLLEHLRLGLVSNMSGISPRHGWRSTVDVLPKLFTVSCLFAPEHGVRGVLGPGEKVSDGRDELTGLYTHSLFEDMVFSPGTDGTDAAYAPRADSLRDLDMLVFDMQDVGSRYFTYASTLLCTMRACAANRVPLCVLDRPNPLGGLVTEGGRQADDCVSFIGLMRMPIRHGLTLGELARYCNEAYALSCDLTVIPCGGLRRSTRGFRLSDQAPTCLLRMPSQFTTEPACLREPMFRRGAAQLHPSLPSAPRSSNPKGWQIQ